MTPNEPVVSVVGVVVTVLTVLTVGVVSGVVVAVVAVEAAGVDPVVVSGVVTVDSDSVVNVVGVIVLSVKRRTKNYSQTALCSLPTHFNCISNVPKITDKQDAQLSQRDGAAGCVTVFAKSRRLELGANILRT